MIHRLNIRWNVPAAVCAVALLLSACTDSKNPKAEPKPKPKPATQSTAPATSAPKPLVDGEPEFLGGTSIVIIPLETMDSEDAQSPSISSGSASEDDVTVFNLAFHDLATGASHLLLDRHAVILQRTVLTSGSNGDAPKALGVLLDIAFEDTNHDGIIDADDASQAHFADVTGTQLTALTPKNAQFVKWVFGENPNAVILYVRTDTNHDGVFSESDGVSPFRFQLSNPDALTPVLPDEMMARAKKLASEPPVQSKLSQRGSGGSGTD